MTSMPLADFAGAGASVPLLGFGHLLAQGVQNAVDECGLPGAFTGGLTAASGGIAASLILLFSVGIFIYHQEKEAQLTNIEPTDTYDNPEDAYAEANRALLKFSKSLNKGLEKVEDVTNKQID